MEKSVISGQDVKLFQRYKNIMPITDSDWYDYARSYLGIKLSRVAIEDYATPPLQIFLKMVKQTCRDLLIIGARDSGKTTMVAAAEVAHMVLRDDCIVCHLSSTKQQALAGYSNVRRILTNRTVNFMNEIDKGPQTNYVRFKNSSEMSLVTGSLNGVNSAHAHKVSVDELDLLGGKAGSSADVRRGVDIFTELQGMTRQSTDLIKTQCVYYSSWKFPYGLVSHLMGAIPDEDRFLTPIEKENVCIMTPMEVMAKCDDDCSKCKAIYEPMRERTFYDYCKMRARQCDGFINHEFYSDIFRSCPHPKWRSQYECLEPNISNRVFDWFTPLSPTYVRKLEFQPDYPLIVGCDFGMTANTVAVFSQFIDGTWYNLAELVVHDVLDDKFSGELKTMAIEKFGRLPDYIFADRAAKHGRVQLNRILRKPVYYATYLIQKLARMSRISEMGQTGKLVNDPSCQKLNQEMLNYHYVGKSLQDGCDDSIDAMSYGFTGWIGMQMNKGFLRNE